MGGVGGLCWWVYISRTVLRFAWRILVFGWIDWLTFRWPNLQKHFFQRISTQPLACNNILITHTILQLVVILAVAWYWPTKVLKGTPLKRKEREREITRCFLPRHTGSFVRFPALTSTGSNIREGGKEGSSWTQQSMSPLLVHFIDVTVVLEESFFFCSFICAHLFQKNPRFPLLTNVCLCRQIKHRFV